MSVHRIHVFISHSWAYSDHYDTLSGWIFDERWSMGQASLELRDYSVPRHDPIHDAPNSRALQEAIFARISRSHIVIIPTGVYASYSSWIRKEIAGAQGYAKPILAVYPWGQQRSSDLVLGSADRTVGWNKKPLIRAIWELYRA